MDTNTNVERSVECEDETEVIVLMIYLKDIDKTVENGLKLAFKIF